MVQPVRDRRELEGGSQRACGFEVGCWAWVGAGWVVQEVRSGILGGARWVGRGRRFMMAVQGNYHSAPAGTGAPPLAPEQERHHWLLRGGGLWEVVAGTNCVSDARARSICVGAAK